MTQAKTLTLADFLLARIADDEAVATRLCPGRIAEHGHWRADSIEFGNVPGRAAPHDRETTKHIMRWDPARVLAECEAKRRIVEEHQRFGSYDERLHDDLVPCLLALPYADHPDYREAWRP